MSGIFLRKLKEHIRLVQNVISHFVDLIQMSLLLKGTGMDVPSENPAMADVNVVAIG